MGAPTGRPFVLSSLGVTPAASGLARGRTRRFLLGVRVVLDRPRATEFPIVPDVTVTPAGTPVPKPAPSAIFRAMAEGGVLFSSESEVYFGVNTVGAVIWELLPTSSTVEELVATLTARYTDVGPERIRHDVESFIADLRANGLVVERGASNGDDKSVSQRTP